MRRAIAAVVLAAALIIPAGAAALDPPSNPAQAGALAAPDKVYLPAAGNTCGIEFTPNLARAWWIVWFADPLDLANVRPGLMPGSLVLTPAEYDRAVALNARGNTLPDAPRDYNPLALPVTAGLVGADGVAFCPTDSAAPPVPLGVSPSGAIARLQVYIANLVRCRCQPAKLAIYRVRLAAYQGRAAAPAR